MDSDQNKKFISLENNVRKLFIVCENIKNKVSSVKIINSNNVVYASLEKFKRLYDDIGAEESMVIFEEFYKKKRIQILCKKDNWIKEKANLEYPVTKRTKTKGMILLSIFYNNALEISKEAEKDVIEFGREDEAANVYLPEELIYPLLEIFLLVAPEEDIEILQSYKHEIVSELPSTNITPTMPAGMSNLGGLLSGILGNLDLSNIQKDMQNMMSEGSQGGSGQPPDLAGAMSKLLSNPKSKEIMNRVTGKFNEVKGFDGLGNAIGGLLTDKQLVEDIQSVTSDLIPKPPDPITDREAISMIENASKVGNASEVESASEVINALRSNHEAPPYDC